MRFFKLTLAVFLLAVTGAAASVSIQLDGSAFRVSGWQPGAEPAGGWASLLTVYAGAASDIPPVFGTYTVESGELTFRPRYPLSPGMKYRAVFRIPGADAVETTLGLPAAVEGQSSTVTSVYPSGEVLPSNQLKLYLYFSRPMRSGEIWQHIRLLDETGTAVKLPFLEIEQELWDPEYKRLTVLFDPGRIKRGVTPLMEMGPVIAEGKRYTLVIDREMRNAEGAPMTETFRKQFRGGPSLRTGIDPKRWKISSPKSGTRDPLVISFDRAIDYGLLQHSIEVMDVDGFVSISKNETEWRFTPAAPWRAGTHSLVISMALEDIAGNRIGRPFDVDTIDNPAPRITQDSMTLPFQIR